MARLGLSDSMRSSVSLEDTEPLRAATHRRAPPRPRAASAAAADASSEQQAAAKATPFVLSKPLQALLGGLCVLALLSTGLRLVTRPLRTWRGTIRQVETQFDELERSLSLLGRDAARLQSTSERFLASCQEAQLAASTRTQMLQSSASRSFATHVKTQVEEHEQVMKEVLRYYAQQEQQLIETKKRLVEMNVTLPVQIAVRAVPESWVEEQRPLEGGEQGEKVDRFDDVEALSFVEGRTVHQDGRERYQPLDVETIAFQTLSDVGKMKTRAVQQSTAYGYFLFYAVVICVSAAYLWNAILDMGKKDLLEDKWSWSPVPTILSRLKSWLGSVVVRS
ncbi:unnamed protein product [Phytophthora lilii]|uniref:Unnamed protein product n=1 Tax=Phytophthora lilii TaxID=2077276 RepID=A0A9W6THS0_9STRA|nr:unnamed protein product [Phytophthora lilii]